MRGVLGDQAEHWPLHLKMTSMWSCCFSECVQLKRPVRDSSFKKSTVYTVTHFVEEGTGQGFTLDDSPKLKNTCLIWRYSEPSLPPSACHSRTQAQVGHSPPRALPDGAGCLLNCSSEAKWWSRESQSHARNSAMVLRTLNAFALIENVLTLPAVF